jgi:hypothetical protein
MMKRNHYIISFVMLATMLLAACGSGSDSFDDEPQNVAESATPKEITIKTNITSMQTRATTIDDDEDLQDYDLKIDAYFHDRETKYLDGTKLHYDSSWKFWNGSAQLHYYWPIEGSVYDPASANITVSSLDFVGYCPYTTPGYITTGPTYNHSTGVTFTCDMSSYMTAASQASITEFMIAKADARTSAGGAVPLTFKHPFACIKFVISEASGTNVQINSISLSELKTGGSCVFDGTTSTWSSQSGSATMTLTQVLKNGGTTEGAPFLVIPNNYGTKTLTVNATWNDWSNETKNVSASVNFNWAAGTSYTYTLTLTKYALKVDTEKYTEQW